MIVNGGVTSLDQAERHLAHVDGVMIGRAAYQNPYILAEVDGRFFGDIRVPPSREAVVRAFSAYVETQRARGVPLKSMTRHILGLFNKSDRARAWRRHLSEAAREPEAGPEIIEAALDRVLAAQRAREAA